MQNVVDEHQQMEEKMRIYEQYVSQDKTRLKEKIQNNNNIDLAVLEVLRQ